MKPFEPRLLRHARRCCRRIAFVGTAAAGTLTDERNRS